MYSEALTIADNNTVKLMIEDMRDEIAAKDNALAAKDQEIAEKDNTIASQADEIAAKDNTIAIQADEIAAKNNALAAKDDEIEKLKAVIEKSKTNK